MVVWTSPNPSAIRQGGHRPSTFNLPLPLPLSKKNNVHQIQTQQKEQLCKDVITRLPTTTQAKRRRGNGDADPNSRRDCLCGEKKLTVRKVENYMFEGLVKSLQGSL
mmetsp:Transcript_35554/g.57526  ORF Transcript_35554/g.57526 Transcript_35554/m.57526 type:complete len:107 (+) Transcript_35554:126-446(+)